MKRIFQCIFWPISVFFHENFFERHRHVFGLDISNIFFKLSPDPYIWVLEGIFRAFHWPISPNFKRNFEGYSLARKHRFLKGRFKAICEAIKNIKKKMEAIHWHVNFHISENLEIIFLRFPQRILRVI